MSDKKKEEIDNIKLKEEWATKLSMARLMASEKLAPYMSSILYLMVPVETDRIPAMAGITPNCKLYYNAKMLEERKISTRELALILLHEAGHIFQDYWDRQDCRDSKDWNIAADMEINDNIAQIDTLPEGLYHPVTFGLPPDKPAEWYYSEIKKKQIKIEIPQDCFPDDSPGNGEGGEGEGEDGDNKKPSQGQGSGEEEEEAGEKKKIQASPGRNKSEIEAAKQATAHQIKAQGNVPGGWLRKAEQLIAPPVLDWRRELTAAARSSIASTKYGLSDYSFSRPNRRHSKSNIIFPSMVTQIPNVGVLIDTSGSMSEKDLQDGLAQTRHILANIDGSIYLAVIDCTLQNFGKVKTVAEIAAKLAGGGGTDLREGFEKLIEVKCDVIIAISDCYATFPSEKPKGNTIFLITSGGTTPPWGKAIFMDGKTPE